MKNEAGVLAIVTAILMTRSHETRRRSGWDQSLNEEDGQNRADETDAESLVERVKDLFTADEDSRLETAYRIGYSDGESGYEWRASAVRELVKTHTETAADQEPKP